MFRNRFMLFVLLSLFPAAQALASVHVGLGWVDEIEGKHSSMVTLSWETDHKHPWEFIGGVISKRDVPQIQTPRVWFGSVSKRLTWNRWFVQGGLAMTNSDTEVLSQHWQFQTGAGYRWNRLTFSVRHLSNANTGGRNRGETWLLAQYGFF